MQTIYGENCYSCLLAFFGATSTQTPKPWLRSCAQLFNEHVPIGISQYSRFNFF